MEKEAFKDVMEFEAWMRDTIKTVHYADNVEMTKAYDRVFSNSLEIIVYERTNRKRNESN